MPNECSNRVTITSTNEEDIFFIVEEINKKIPNVHIIQHSKRGLRVHYITAWTPNFHFTETLVEKYPFVWIKNEWLSEDGSSGVWIGKKNDIKSLVWEDMSVDAEHFFFSD